MNSILNNIESKIYSNKFNHVYFYENINNKSMINIKIQINELNLI